MTLEEKQNFRKKILKLHYEISGADSWSLVLRSIVAERLGFNNYNDSELLGAIKYLEDGGFLKAMTNVEDQITKFGIDEVEKNFPNFNGNTAKGFFPGVYISAKKIVNNGEISAEGISQRAEIITEDCKNNGTITVKGERANKIDKKRFWEQTWFQIIMLLAAVATIISLFWH